MTGLYVPGWVRHWYLEVTMQVAMVYTSWLLLMLDTFLVVAGDRS